MYVSTCARGAAGLGHKPVTLNPKRQVLDIDDSGGLSYEEFATGVAYLSSLCMPLALLWSKLVSVLVD